MGYVREVTGLLAQLIALLVCRQQLLAQVLERLAGLPPHICDLHMFSDTSHSQSIVLLYYEDEALFHASGRLQLNCAPFKGAAVHAYAMITREGLSAPCA